MFNKTTVFALLIFTASLYAGGQMSKQANKYPDPERWEKDIQNFEFWDAKNSYPADSVLFVGSSSIYCWESAKYFPDLPVINRGFGGSLVFDSLHYADRIILPYKPKVVVFYAGDNDVMANKPPAMINDDFMKLAAKIHKSLSNTEIICLAVKPSPRRWDRWGDMQEVNKLNKLFADKTKGVTFVDTGSCMLGADGKPVEAYYRDGLHFTAKGYDVWNKIVGPVIYEKYKIAMGK